MLDYGLNGVITHKDGAVIDSEAVLEGGKGYAGDIDFWCQRGFSGAAGERIGKVGTLRWSKHVLKEPVRVVGVPIHTLTFIPLSNEIGKVGRMNLGELEWDRKNNRPTCLGTVGLQVSEYDYMGVVKRPLLVDIVTMFQALIAKTEFQRVYV